MRLIRDVTEVRASRKGVVGLVPTMGALHDGHLELIRKSRSECDTTIATIFVNPTQFAPGEDFERYPRQLDRDAELAEGAGCDVLFVPDVDTVYPRKTTWIDVEEVTELFEGAHRPGHFRGVATVVAKLFLMCLPDRAYFGLKDLQQCAVIRRMVEDLMFPIELRFVETVREPDGLAMSSRNRYLSAEQRKVAAELYRTIRSAADRLGGSGTVSEDADRILAAARAHLEERGFQVDYLDLVDPETMRPTRATLSGYRVVVAAKLGDTRLIDNVPIID
ncbi:MAG: pantoate--beta-alanine ligase [Fimbriimonadaceae bacterium]